MKRAEYLQRSREFAKRGSDLPQTKLNEKLVRQIRKEHAEALRRIAEIRRQSTANVLASRYGVHVRTVEKVLSYETWRHVR